MRSGACSLERGGVAQHSDAHLSLSAKVSAIETGCVQNALRSYLPIIRQKVTNHPNLI